MRRAWAFLIAVAAFISQSRCEAGLIINLTDLGGSAVPTSPTTTGTGTLSTVMRAAADVWQLAFNSSTFTHTLTLGFRWFDITDAGVLAQHSLTGQTGSPNRETGGMIQFDNSGSSFFLDGTLNTTSLAALSGAASSSEFSGYTEATQDFGGGAINTRRTLSAVVLGDADNRIDAFSVALHEIGHALGMSSANFSYQTDSWPDNDVDVAGSMPFAGSAIPTSNTATPTVDFSTSSAHLNISNALLFPSISSGIRRLPSAVDILANAQLSQFTNPNLDLDAASVPEPSSLLLAIIIGGCGFVSRVRRRRETAGTKTSAA